MALGRSRWPFRETLVLDAPEHAGLYALWDEERIIELGIAPGGDDTIRSRLLALLQRCGEGGRAPSHYSWEITSRPSERLRQVLPALQPAIAAP